MSARLNAVLQANEYFAKAYAKAEPWAVEQAEAILGLDGMSRGPRFPERKPDGIKHNWCGTCPYELGCVVCDLPGDHKAMKNFIGVLKDHPGDVRVQEELIGIRNRKKRRKG